jgi:hypothetical protein
MKAYPCPTPVPYARDLPPDGADAGLDLALREIAVPDEGLPPLRVPSVGILGAQHRDCHLDRVRQEALRALA